jgi:predicted ATPase
VLPGGSAFVPLASIQDPGLILAAIARVLDLRDTAQRPLSEVVATALRDCRFLLVQDNFEHVLPAARDIAMKDACPGLTVLATSRARLHLSSGIRMAVPPWALPGSEQDLAIQTSACSGAVALVGERARQVQAAFLLDQVNAQAAEAVCRRLDGLPLAIELAAARMQVLSPALLLERLEPPLPLLRGMATCRASLLKRSVSRTGALILRRPTAGLVSGWRHANAKCWRWWSLAARTR